MTMPGFSAETSLYKTSIHKGLLSGSARADGSVIQQLNVVWRTLPVYTACELAQSQCIQNNAMGSGSDPGGWCAWYQANCVTAPPPTPGVPPSGCPAGCTPSIFGCICSPRGGNPLHT